MSPSPVTGIGGNTRHFKLRLCEMCVKHRRKNNRAIEYEEKSLNVLFTVFLSFMVWSKFQPFILLFGKAIFFTLLFSLKQQPLL